MIFNLFKRKEKNETVEDSLFVDMHSHVLPGIDDGADSPEDALELLRAFQAFGYKKLIATPHIMGDFFRNTPEIISEKLQLLQCLIRGNNLSITLEAAAEYYLDEWFMAKLRSGEKVLTFGDNYLLFETSYINESAFLDEALFLMKTQGYKPVMAHPERYTYLYSDFSLFKKIYEKGVLFQVNINSLSGYYSKAAQTYAAKLIDHSMVDMLGSDCHGTRHIEAMKKARSSKHYKKALQLNLLNNYL
jgi:protein-tyrosine phosphatase